MIWKEETHEAWKKDNVERMESQKTSAEKP
jgi:hypothetical protein